MAQQKDNRETPYQQARQSHRRQIEQSNAAYRRGEIDIYELMRRGQWANYELSQHEPDRKHSAERDS